MKEQSEIQEQDLVETGEPHVLKDTSDNKVDLSQVVQKQSLEIKRLEEAFKELTKKSLESKPVEGVEMLNALAEKLKTLESNISQEKIANQEKILEEKKKSYLKSSGLPETLLPSLKGSTDAELSESASSLAKSLNLDTNKTMAPSLNSQPLKPVDSKVTREQFNEFKKYYLSMGNFPDTDEAYLGLSSLLAMQLNTPTNKTQPLAN